MNQYPPFPQKLILYSSSSTYSYPHLHLQSHFVLSLLSMIQMLLCVHNDCRTHASMEAEREDLEEVYMFRRFESQGGEGGEVRSKSVQRG